MRSSERMRPNPGVATALNWMQIGLVILAIALVLIVPAMTFLAAMLCLFAQFALVSICNLHSFFRSGRSSPSQTAARTNPSIALSVHVAACNEPADLLIATLESLRRQISAPDHEIIVMINNTADPALWRPVEHWCLSAGDRFHFVRRHGVTGAKAGALNIALQHSQPRTTHIVVLDADYQVHPNFLQIVGAQITESDADFIQFPQAYRHVSPQSEGLSFELAEYFARHARAANMAQAMLLTGTLSVIRRDALAAVGGWPGQSCTEDAELGTVLIAAGYHGIFVDRVVGCGLMPLDLAGLHAQRFRWAAGNARVLATVLGRWSSQKRSLRAIKLQDVLIIAQLSAWLNLGALALATAMASMLQLWLSHPDMSALTLPDLTLLLSTLSFFLILLGTVSPLLGGVSDNPPFAIRWHALASRLAMVPISASATIAGLSPRRQVFKVTRKQSALRAHPSLNLALATVTLAAIAMLGLAVLMQDPVAGLSGVLLLLPLMGTSMSRRSISKYAADVVTGEPSWICPSAS